VAVHGDAICVEAAFPDAWLRNVRQPVLQPQRDGPTLAAPADVPIVTSPFQLPDTRNNGRLGLALHVPPINAPVIPIYPRHTTDCTAFDRDPRPAGQANALTSTWTSASKLSGGINPASPCGLALPVLQRDVGVTCVDTETKKGFFLQRALTGSSNPVHRWPEQWLSSARARMTTVR
jgi:hypothetical protein